MSGKSIIHQSVAMRFKKFTKGTNEPLFKQPILYHCCQSSNFFIHIMVLDDRRFIANILHHQYDENYIWILDKTNQQHIN